MRRLGLLLSALLFAPTAFACVPVRLPARELFHDATTILRATATDANGAFRVTKSWRGKSAVGSDVSVLLHVTDLCAQEPIVIGKEYLVVAHKGEDYAYARAIDRSDEEIAYLHGGRRTIERSDFMRVLREWQDGDRTANQVEAWIREASLSDVNDWSRDGNSLLNDVMTVLGLQLHMAVAGRDEALAHGVSCNRLTAVEPHIAAVLDLLRMPVAQTDKACDRWDELSQRISADLQQKGPC